MPSASSSPSFSGWAGTEGPWASTSHAGSTTPSALAAYALPLVLCVVGGLLLVRSALVDVRPFRTGLAVGAVGLAIALGKEHGGIVGSALGGGLARVVGETGALIVGVTLLVAGALLVSGASAGALLRRSGHAMRRAGSVARRSLERPPQPDLCLPCPLRSPHRPPVDVTADYPDVIAPASAEPPPLAAPRR